MGGGQSLRKRAEEESTEGASTSSISSAATSAGSDQYDVFLSFRGSDTRKEFTDHLYHSLVKAGIVGMYVFKDDKSILIGEEFGSQIFNAIAQSKISIPIISENYASSKWCLRELIHIMDRKKSSSHIVLPIYYKVAASDVRYLKGNFGQAFRMSKKHFDEEDIQKAKQALTEVSYLQGWESSKVANGREGELIQLVVKAVLSKLQRDFQLDIPGQPVGLDGCLMEIMKWIRVPSVNARMFGIFGMAGIGKTTLAKRIYNELLDEFEHASFLSNIREKATHHSGMEDLQSQLISDILRHTIKVSRVDDGINISKSRFKGKKVLILLDDIDDKNQLDVLARERDWFMAGSMIIVTTRNGAVLDQSEFEVDYKYEMEGLNEVQSLLLFNRHAFHMDHSPRDFESISRDIISTMDGIPLALEIVGSYLYKNTNRKVWEDVRRQLKSQPRKDVSQPRKDVKKILHISYDALKDGQKQIFLDIVCFFISESLDGLGTYMMCMWEDYGLYPSLEIEELKLRRLIKIGDGGEFEMHDQLKDLGRNMIQQERLSGAHSRLWLYKDVSEVLMGGKRPRFDDLMRAASSGDENLSEVRWLQWRIDESDSSLLPANLRLPKLAVLDLAESDITEDWEGWSSLRASTRLRALNLPRCSNLKSTPDLSAFPRLKILNLYSCSKLEHLHPSIGKLKSLVSLNLSKCKSLKELPEEVGELEDLEELDLSESGITQIPASIHSLGKLKKLVVVGCTYLRGIPSSIGDLQNLQHLDISHSAIERLPSLRGTNPSEIGDLSLLKILNLACCNYLRYIPDHSPLKGLEILILKHCDGLEQVHPSVGKLKSLVSLDLSDCGSLKELPEELGKLEELKELILDSTGVIEIPTSIGSLRKLEKLSAYFCRSLRKIPHSIGNLQNLQDLDISHSAIEELPVAIGRLKKLRRLNLKFCYLLKGEILNEVGDLSSLEILDITSTGIVNVPNSICNLSSLRCLSLWGCYELKSLPELPFGLTNLSVSFQSPTLPQLSCLVQLEELDLYKCVQLEYIPELPSRLRKLCVASCHKLIFPEFKVFQYLEELSIKYCGSIETLDLSMLNRLKCLHAEDCYNLVEIRSHNVEFLGEVIIDCCKSIERLIFPGLRCLKQLKAKYCDNLVEIQGLHEAEVLQVLDISYCECIERLPGLSCFQTLKELNINGCCNLRGVESLERFLFCRSIYITGCLSLEKLPDLSKFENLENFTVRYSLGVTEIPGIDESRSLTHIDITGCKSMEILPDLSRCDKLQSLVVRDCKKLTHLQGLEKLHLTYLDISGCDSLKTIPKLPETPICRNYERAQDEVPDGNIILQ